MWRLTGPRTGEQYRLDWAKLRTKARGHGSQLGLSQGHSRKRLLFGPVGVALGEGPLSRQDGICMDEDLTESGPCKKLREGRELNLTHGDSLQMWTLPRPGGASYIGSQDEGLGSTLDSFHVRKTWISLESNME